MATNAGTKKMRGDSAIAETWLGTMSFVLGLTGGDYGVCCQRLNGERILLSNFAPHRGATGLSSKLSPMPRIDRLQSGLTQQVGEAVIIHAVKWQHLIAMLHETQLVVLRHNCLAFLTFPCLETNSNTGTHKHGN